MKLAQVSVDKDGAELCGDEFHACYCHLPAGHGEMHRCLGPSAVVDICLGEWHQADGETVIDQYPTGGRTEENAKRIARSLGLIP